MTGGTSNVEVMIIGGGAIGLSIAYQLARSGCRVRLLDRQQLGRESSWAGAGILPAVPRGSAVVDPLDQLRALSHELHGPWHRQLLEETGIDNGYRRCGGIYLARTPGEAAALAGWHESLRALQVDVQKLSLDELRQVEPALAALVASGTLRAAYRMPDEAQLRNPRHLKALAAACRHRGVDIREHTEVTSLLVSGSRVEGVETIRGRLSADRYCVAAGAWAGPLLERIGRPVGVLPVRGQMVLFAGRSPLLTHVLNVGSRYLVPRPDGRLLVGSTEEEVGFDTRTTPQAIQELVQLATQLLPQLAQETIQRSWAGLRPGSFDGLPYLGRIPDLENAFLAAGHFRSGLHLSTGTAVVMDRLIRGETPPISLDRLGVGR